MDLNPVEQEATFSFDLQVWRPSPTINDDGSGCYSLVGNYAVRSISINTTVEEDHVARVTPSVQLQYQPGDVLGFYVESDGTNSDDDNGVVLLVSASYTSELVWHASITDRSSMSGSCPYPVGTSGVLSSSTRAAPVISISTSAFSCPQSFSTVVSFTPTSTLNNSLLSSSMIESVTSTESVHVALPTAKISDSGAESNNTPLIAGAVVAFLVACIILTTLIIVVVVAVVKKRRDKDKGIGQAFANQVYGMLNFASIIDQ